jgi:hypothetical protein
MRWYVEAREGEDWRAVSELFADWLEATIDTTGLTFGWHEWDSVRLPDGRQLLAFQFSDRYGEKVMLLERWARTTGRLYGAKDGQTIRFPA